MKDPTAREIHAWIDRAYRGEPNDSERRFTRWNMEAAYLAGWRAGHMAVSVADSIRVLTRSNTRAKPARTPAKK